MADQAKAVKTMAFVFVGIGAAILFVADDYLTSFGYTINVLEFGAMGLYGYLAPKFLGIGYPK